MQPEQARGWLQTIMPVLREGGPIVSLVLLVLGGATIWWLLHMNERSHMVSVELFERLLKCHQEHINCEKVK